MKGYIYKITSPSGKVYIGQTIDINKRIAHYKTMNCRQQPKLYNSIKKYGWNAHVFEILEEINNEYIKFWLNLQEIYWIDFYHSCIDGLNCTTGGEGSNHSQETKQKISDNHARSNKNNLKTGKKICSRCKEEKILDQFDLRPNTKDGRRNPCKKCRQEERQNPDNKKKHAEYNKEYYHSGYNQYHRELYKKRKQ